MSANPISSTLAALLENAAAAALNLDPDARAQIAELNEQILLLELTVLPSTAPQTTALPLALRVHCLAADGGRLSIMADSRHNTRAPNAIVRGSVASFIQALLPGNKRELPEGIEIEGDERLLMALQSCFRGLQPNAQQKWREPLDNFVATVAQRFGGSQASAGAPPLVQDILGQAELAFATLKTALSDALTGGKEAATDASAKFWVQDDDIDAFARRLEDLQLKVDRLRAAIELAGNNPADRQ